MAWTRHKSSDGCLTSACVFECPAWPGNQDSETYPTFLPEEGVLDQNAPRRITLEVQIPRQRTEANDPARMIDTKGSAQSSIPEV